MPSPPLIGIKETCLYVADTERTRTFYADRLGLECFNHKPGLLVFFRAGSSVLLCFNADRTRTSMMFRATSDPVNCTLLLRLLPDNTNPGVHLW